MVCDSVDACMQVGKWDRDVDREKGVCDEDINSDFHR